MANAYSGLNRQRVVAKAYEVTVVEFFDTSPNYFRVINNGAGRVYCSANRHPTLVNFDFACDGGQVQLWAEPHERKRLYIFNPTGSDCALDVLSFYAKFDPLALAFTALRLDFSGVSLETSTAITSFNSALPQGNNKIGNVGVSGALPAGNNKIGNVSISGAIPAGDNIIGKVVISEVDYFTETQSSNATSSGVVYGTVENYFINNLCFMSNDGDADITLTIVDFVDDATHNIVVKAGEVLNDIKCKAKQFRIAGSNVPFRMVYNLREV